MQRVIFGISVSASDYMDLVKLMRTTNPNVVLDWDEYFLADTGRVIVGKIEEFNVNAYQNIVELFDLWKSRKYYHLKHTIQSPAFVDKFGYWQEAIYCILPNE